MHIFLYLFILIQGRISMSGSRSTATAGSAMRAKNGFNLIELKPCRYVK